MADQFKTLAALNDATDDFALTEVAKRDFASQFNIYLKPNVTAPFTGTIVLERRRKGDGPSGIYYPISANGIPLFSWAFSASSAQTSEMMSEPESETLWRLRVSAYTSGDIRAGLSCAE